MMKKDYQRTSILDVADEIYAMHARIQHLEAELAHYKYLHDLHLQSMRDTETHHGEMMGIILNAVIDPNSAPNVAARAVAEDPSILERVVPNRVWKDYEA